MKSALFCVLVLCFTVSVFSQNIDDFEYTYSEKERGLVITFYYGRKRTVKIPSQIDGLPITRIGFAAFNDTKLTSITIPDSVISIGVEAFSENKLTTITIPNSVTNINYGAFLENRLTSITIGSNVSIINKAFDSEFDAFYQAQGRKAGTYTLKNGVWSVK
jgi:hypothetical protein